MIQNPKSKPRKQSTENQVPQIPSLIPPDQFSSEDYEPLSELRSRSRKNTTLVKIVLDGLLTPRVARSRTLLDNIVLEKEGIKPPYNQNTTPTPLDIWQLFFTDEMFETIVRHTNAKIQQLRPNYKKQTCVQDLDLIELKGFIGLLFYTAIFKENREHYTSWYSTDGTGREIYRCIISKNRFEILLKALRFDAAESRPLRRENNPASPISALFDSFIERCQAVYTIGTCACIDEMLLAFRGRCKFKMYMPKKPAKYGIKIHCLTDAKSGYLLNAYIYDEKDSDGLNLPTEYQRLKKPTQAVMRLNFHNRGFK
jgi:hypothetical protein